QTLDVSGNALTSLTLPPGLSHLSGLFLAANQLTSLTLPPDMTNLTALSFLSNPLFNALVVSTTLAASTNLNVNLGTLSSLPSQGVTVFVYPPALQLTSPHPTATGAFKFTLTGPPGHYAIQNSTNLSNWSASGAVTNLTGRADFTDSGISPQKFF